MARNSGGYEKNHSFPESAFIFNSLNRKEKKKKRQRERARETEVGRETEKQMLGPHPTVSQGNDSLMNSFFFHLGANILQGAQGFQAGFAQVVV